MLLAAGFSVKLVPKRAYSTTRATVHKIAGPSAFLQGVYAIFGVSSVRSPRQRMATSCRARGLCKAFAILGLQVCQLSLPPVQILGVL